VHPEVSLSVSGGGSGTGIAALINNTVGIANASRAIKQVEIDEAKANGITPVEFTVARDAIGIIVNKHNPIDRLTLSQLADIFTGRIDNWSEVGGDDLEIVRLSRETNSGTHVYFLETVIRLGNKENTDIFSRDTLLLPSSEGIIAEVRDNPHAIGYDGLGYITDEVKVIAVAPDADSAYILPSVATVNDGRYPIARDLYMYTPGEPTAAVKAYIEWILSPEGQKIVLTLGFVPIIQ
jgi:phosphate transport system substrate-binding protein